MCSSDLADYLFALTSKQGLEIIGEQVNFYRQLLGNKLKFTQETAGILAPSLVDKNQEKLQQILAKL